MLSPHFPPNYYPFCLRLREFGVTVLGIADAPREELRPDLREALPEYYRVGDLHDYGQLLRACGHFIHRHGRIDRIDSRSDEEVLEAFGALIPHHEEIRSVFRAAIGDYGYIARSPELDDVLAAVRFIHEIRQGSREGGRERP